MAESSKKVTVILAGSATGLAKTFEEASAAADRSAKGMAKAFNDGSTKVGNVFQNLGKTLGNWGLPFSESLTKMGDKMAEAETKAQHLGAVLGATAKIGAVVGIAGFGVVAAESIKMATSFQSSMTMLATQAGVPQGQIKALSNGVLDLAGKVGFSPDSLSEALYHIESTLPKTMSAQQAYAQAMSETATAAEGAKVGHANLEDVTNALNAAVASGIPGVQNLNQAMGALNSTVGAGDMKMQDLAEAMGTGVLAVVKGYGVNLNDVGAALATFGDNNIRGADAATELRMAVQALAVPAAGGKKTLESLGLTTKTLSDDLKTGGLNKALTDLHDHLVKTGNDGANAGEILTAAFGKKAGVGLQVLEEQYGRFESKTKEVADGANTFGAAWSATQKTLGQQVDQLKAGFESLATRIGIVLIPIATKIVGWFNKALPGIERFAGEVFHAVRTGFDEAVKVVKRNAPAFEHAFGNAEHAFHNIVHAGENVAHAMGNVIHAGENVAHAFANVVHAISDVVNWFGKHRAVAIALASAIGVILLPSIIGLATTGASALAGLVSSFAETAALKAMYFGDMVRSGAQWVASTVKQFATAIAEGAKWIAQQAVIVARTTANFARMVAQGAVWVAQQTAQLAKSIAAGAVWLAEHAVMAATYIAQNIAMAASATAAFIAENAATLGIIAAIAAVIAAIVFLATHWKQVWNDIKHWAEDAWHFIYDGFGKYLLVFLGPAGLLALGAIELAKHWKQVWGDIKTAAVDAWHFLDNDVIHPIVDFFENVWKGDLAAAKDAWSTLWNGVQSIIQTVWSIIKPILDTIKRAIDDTVGAVGKVADVAGKLGGGVVGGVAKAGGWLKHHLAEGGIVTGPTIAEIGESGPEAVIPLTGRMGSLITGSVSPLPNLSGGAGPAVVYSPTFQIHAPLAPAHEVQQLVRKTVDDSHQELLRMLGQVS